MNKQLLFLLVLLAFLVGCGQKSVIKSEVEAQTFAQAYGDGEYVIRPVYLPLSDEQIPVYDSPVEKVDFVAGGIGRMVMDLGAGMGAGRVKISMVQPIPEISTEVIKGAKIKRLFVFLEPKEGKGRWRSIFHKILFGQGDVTFKFLDKLAVKLSSHHKEKITSWIPDDPIVESLRKKEYTPLQSLFEGEEVYDADHDSFDDKSLVILKYDGRNPLKYLRNEKSGKMYILKARRPAQTKKYLMKHPRLKNHIQSIFMLNQSLVVELKKNMVSEENFRVLFADNNEQMDMFKIQMIEECSPETCLDLEVPDVNLLPIIIDDNSIRFDAYIDSRKTPESFQLKGFAEFEIKMKLDF